MHVYARSQPGVSPLLYSILFFKIESLFKTGMPCHIQILQDLGNLHSCPRSMLSAEQDDYIIKNNYKAG